jgi:hypothetical protein
MFSVRLLRATLAAAISLVLGISGLVISVPSSNKETLLWVSGGPYVAASTTCYRARGLLILGGRQQRECTEINLG